MIFNDLRNKLKKNAHSRSVSQQIDDGKMLLTNEKYVKLSDVEVLLDSTEKTHLLIERKKLQDRFNEIIDSLVEHDVCCVPCLEKGQAMELQKLLEGDEK